MAPPVETLKTNPRQRERLVKLQLEEHSWLHTIEVLCSFDELLPSYTCKIAALEDRSPLLAQAKFKDAAEYFGGSGLAHSPDRIKVLKRIIEVIKPLALISIDYELFPAAIENNEKLQYQLSHLYHHLSIPFLQAVLNKYPRLYQDVPHFYALAACFSNIPRGIDKVLMRSEHSERSNRAIYDLMSSYVAERGLTEKAVKTAKRVGISVSINPKYPYFSIRRSLNSYSEALFSRAMLLDRYDETLAAAKLAAEMMPIMQENEPEETEIAALGTHWNFIVNNFPQLKKEFRYIAGKGTLN